MQPQIDHAQWETALKYEVDFWNKMVSEKGWQWPEDFQRRIDPHLSLDSAVSEFLPPGNGSVEILDVGAGPLTQLGKKCPGRILKITAVDPLAHEYDRILAAQQIIPTVRTIPGDASKLIQQFGRDRFDLVFCKNAMDHGYDPVGGILNSLGVVKPGCWVTLFHFIDEGVHEKYTGLHQWNFNVDHGRFIIWNPSTRVDVQDVLGPQAAIIRCDMMNQRLLRVAIQKPI
jgi:hypothetical protein